MSVKIYFFHNHPDRFPENCGVFSDEDGERFQVLVPPFGKRYKSKNLVHMLGGYCWSTCRENDEDHER